MAKNKTTSKRSIKRSRPAGNSASAPFGQPTVSNIIDASVKVYETNRQNRYAQYTAYDLCTRYAKYVFKCVNINAGAFASVPFHIVRAKKSGSKVSAYRTRRMTDTKRASVIKSAGHRVRKFLSAGDDVEIIDDKEHPLFKLLNDAWPGGNCYELFWLTEAHQALAGNAYWAKVRNTATGLPVELWPMHPAWTRIVPSKTDFIEGFIFGRQAQDEKAYAREDVVFHRRPNPIGNDPYYGYADVRACIFDADVSVAFSQFALATLDNSAQPGMVVMMEGATDSARKQVEAALESKFSGASNAARSMVLSNQGGKISVAQWMQQTRELSFLASDEKARDHICNILGVPLAFVTMDSASLAQAKEATPMHQKYTILPKLRMFEDTINAQVTPDFQQYFGDESLMVVFDNPVDRDFERDSVVHERLYRAGIQTVNEARLGMDMEPVDDGDTLIDISAPVGGPFGNFTDQPEKPKPADEPIEIEEDKDDGDVTDEAAKAIKALAEQVATLTKLVAPAPLTHCREVAPMTKRAGVPFDKAMTNKGQTLTATAGDMYHALRRWFGGLTPMMSQWIDVDTGTVKRNLSSFPEVRSMFDEATVSHILEVMQTSYAAEVENMGNKAGQASMEVFGGRASVAVANRQGPLFASVTQETQDRVMTRLADDIAKGATLPERIEGVSAELVIGSDYDAERITRTETAAAYGQARDEAWQDSKTVERKEWLLSGNACPLCVALSKNYQFADLGKPFVQLGETIYDTGGKALAVNSYRPIDCPPGHPNCRCSMGAVYRSNE